MKIRMILTIAVLSLISSLAAAQTTLTDPASGLSVTIPATWQSVEAEGVVMATDATEECVAIMTAVPMAEAEAVLGDLVTFVGQYVENPVIANSEETEDTLMVTGTGVSEGTPVSWMLAAGQQGEYAGIVFLGASDSATCVGDLETILASIP